MFHNHNILDALGLVAASATIVRASAQAGATVLDRICDGTALVCLGLLLVLIARFSVVLAP
jgi:hypothetical protein